MAEQKRTPREISNRQQDTRPQKWQPPELLPEPDKLEGWSYRWIRVSMLNQPDARNISSKMREGWEPVKIEEQPKFQLLVDPNSRFQGNIEIGGLLLCKTPAEFVEQRKEYYEGVTKSQTEAVDSNLMRQSDPRMPIFKERSSSTSVGK